MRNHFFFLNVVLFVSFMVFSALNLQAQDTKPFHPIILEVIMTEEAETENGPMGRAYYRIESKAMFEVEMKQNPFTGRIGSAACQGYEVAFSKLKDDETFCFRLRYLDGKVLRAVGASGREKAIFKEVPEKRTWAVPADGAVMSRRDGKAEIKVYTPTPLADNGAAEEAMTCHPLEPELILRYVEIRDLINLSRQWFSSKFPPEQEQLQCKGNVNVKIRAVGGEVSVPTCSGRGGFLPIGGKRCKGGDFDGWRVY